MRILLTGGKGFIGSGLTRSLVGAGHEVWANEFELRDSDIVENAVSAASWDAVIHLAALSHMRTCESEPELAMDVNRAGTARLISAVGKFSPWARFIFVSTAQVYQGPQGDEILQGLTIDEERSLKPQNFYAQTKFEAESEIRACSERLGMGSTILRLFNHTHSTQAPDAFLPHIHKSILEAKSSGKTVIPVGNLDLDRDIGGIQDLIRAFHAVLKTAAGDKVTVYNICSGKTKRLRKLAELLAKRLEAQVEFAVDPARLRPNEPLFICGSHRKFTEKTGWQPTCQTEESLIDAFLSVG